MADSTDLFTARLRDVAYAIWEREGRPNVDPRELWQRAKSLVAAEEPEIHELGEPRIPNERAP
jgi:Protein of unknown function (DUF2934)